MVCVLETDLFLTFVAWSVRLGFLDAWDYHRISNAFRIVYRIMNLYVECQWTFLWGLNREIVDWKHFVNRGKKIDFCRILKFPALFSVRNRWRKAQEILKSSKIVVLSVVLMSFFSSRTFFIWVINENKIKSLEKVFWNWLASQKLSKLILIEKWSF